MATYHEKVTELIQEDADGNIIKTITAESSAFKRSTEPEYIKLYTKMWCEFNAIPDKWHSLFLALAQRMNYASVNEPYGGQIVYTVGTNVDAIMSECNWKNKQTLYNGLKELCKCGAIRKIKRGEYQINPQYAGRGGWRYNAAANQGGVEDLIAKFNFKDGTVDTEIVWASSEPDEIGKDLEQVTIKQQKINPRSNNDGNEDNTDSRKAVS